MLLGITLLIAVLLAITQSNAEAVCNMALLLKKTHQTDEGTNGKVD